MVSMTPIEILTELRESGEDYENAILSTFSFSPSFFESKILPILRSKDIQNIMLLIDPIDHETTFKEAKQIGVLYLLEPMSIRNTFHPKFLLLTSNDAGKLIIGSANITQEGYTSNAEVLTSLDYDKDNPSAEVLSLFVEMKEFLRRLVEKGLIKSNKHIAKIVQTIDVPWLDGKPIVAEKVRLIHSLDVPILEQIHKTLEGQDIEQITISSFLFGPEVIRYICERLCKRLNIIVQPGRVVGLSQSELESIIKDTEAKLNFYKIVFKDEEPRFLHAKIILVKTNKGSYCLTGSANLTSSALLSTPTSGNVEVCLFRFEESKDYFDYLFDNDSVATEKIDLNEIMFTSLSPLPSSQKFDLGLTEARIEGSNLIIEFSPLTHCCKLARIIIRRAVAVEPKILDAFPIEDNKIIVKLSDDVQRYCQDSCYVVLELRRENDDPNPLISNKRWISTEIAELIPSNRDVETIRKTDGRVGLIKLLNQLDRATESPQMLLYYLQFIDFDWLFETVSRVRKHVVRTADPEEFEGQKSMLERLNITPEYVLTRILKRHEGNFERLTTYIEPEPDLVVKVEKIFNLFMFINKIIIWFVLNRKCPIQELRHICGCNGTIDIFCGRYVDTLRKVLGKESVDNLMNRLDVLEHVMVLSKIIRDIQRSDSAYEKINVGPIRVFNENYCKSLRNLCENPTEIITKGKSKLPKVIKEYEEFQGINLRAEDILDNVSNILR